MHANLAKRIDEAIRRHGSAAGAQTAAEAKLAERRDRAAAKAAAVIVHRLVAMVEDALAEGRSSVNLYEAEDVVPTVDGLAGVAGKIRDHLTEEGLADRLWVDIDASGNHTARNALMFRIKPKR